MKQQEEQFSSGKLLPVMEEFISLQGEGIKTGTAAYFLRVGGCDVGCYWCDVKESWDASLHPLVQTEDVISRIKESGMQTVLITGGEPLLYPMDYLCQQLKDIKVNRFLETSGSEKLSGEWEWICLSPKKNAPPFPEIYSKANELKVIITSPSDLAWAESEAKKVNPNCEILLQPEWSKRNEITPILVSYIIENNQWKLSLQAHKYINIP